MNRLVHHLAHGALVLAMAGLTACSLANTAPPHVEPTPTPAPTPKFSNQTYAAALRTASVKLRGKLPDPADLQSVLANGQPAYEALIDQYLDPAQNTALGTQIRTFYNAVFLMGDVVTVNGQQYNDNQPPDLAAYIVLNDRPVTELLTADYCVNDNFQMIQSGLATGADADGSTADAKGCPSDSTPDGERAGIISQKPFLAKFGTASTVNMRRMSVIHQIFNCAIYPDSADVPLARTNDSTQDAADANNANPSCAVDGCPDNGLPGVAIPSDPMSLHMAAETCPGSPNYPCNNNGSVDDPSDDFADPSLGKLANDPVAPLDRVSKKYQSKLAGSVGQPCADCHGSINARRPIMIAYDENGIYDANRTTQDVESPDVNGNKDYCGMATPADATDDIDPAAADCQNGAKPQGKYFGQPIATLKDYGAALISQQRFFDCMTTRHYDFVLGKTQGELGLQAAGGSGPAAMDATLLTKYKMIYQSSGWNTRELFRAVFKGDEFLTSQTY